jgi:hypothetical protein
MTLKWAGARRGPEDKIVTINYKYVAEAQFLIHLESLESELKEEGKYERPKTYIIRAHPGKWKRNWDILLQEIPGSLRVRDHKSDVLEEDHEKAIKEIKKLKDSVEYYRGGLFELARKVFRWQCATEALSRTGVSQVNKICYCKEPTP